MQLALFGLEPAQPQVSAPTATILPEPTAASLSDYDAIIVAFSGGSTVSPVSCTSSTWA